MVTEYRPRSHADVIVTKLLEGYDLYGTRTEPRVEVASLYLDQVPENDIGRGLAERHGVPIFDSIGEAIAVGGRGVNVDGVLLIGEHGQYPLNELGQKLYPRRRFFDAAVAAMVGAGRFVPVFNDKHLSWSFGHARWMYDTARRLGIPFLAGSSLPVAWRAPVVDWPLDVRVEEALVFAHGPLESYGFHALETLQCMLERRVGGESGVRRVQCLRGAAVWKADAEGRWSGDLRDALCATLGGLTRQQIVERATDPAAFLIEYRGGLRAAVLMLNGAVEQFAFAARREGAIDACRFVLQRGDPHGHFTFLVRQIESLVHSGAPPYPVERTLLTTGVLDALMRSNHEGGAVVETPELGIVYTAPETVPDTGVGASPPTS